MSETLTDWRTTRDINYLGSWDVPTTGDLILTIKSVAQETVVNPQTKEEKVKTVIHFVEKDYKPMVLNTTNKAAIESATGTKYIEQWVGHAIGIYTKRVKAFGKETDALRIRETSPDVRTYDCEECGNLIVGLGGKTASELVEISKRNCNGKALCVACQKKFKAAMEKKPEPVKETKPEPEPVKEEEPKQDDNGEVDLGW